MIIKFNLLVLIFVALLTFNAQGQFDAIDKRFNAYRSQTLTEKIYIHMDRPYYLIGETVWFKIYYVDGSFHRPLDVSKVIYVDLVDGSGTIHVQSKISMLDGGGSGCFKLPTNLKTGNYKVKAYTNLMRNFSEDYYFSERITLINPFLSLEKHDVSSVNEYDAQFFPEGGYLVNDLTSRVAFRVVNNQGIGLDFSGVIVDNNNNPLVTFKPDKFGLGSFYLRPQKGKTYKAILKHTNLTSTEHNLPEALVSGYVMEVKDTTDNLIKVVVKAGGLVASESIYLFVHTRNIKLIAHEQIMINGSAYFLIHKDSVREGVSHFTIFDQMLKPVGERLFFKRPKSTLDVLIQTEKQVFTPREKINLSIVSPDQPNVSVAVYRLDSICSQEHADITTHLNLLSDLRNNIERPAYYFSDSATQVEYDNLMLTHGWRRFKWTQIMGGDSLTINFMPEINGHRMRGVVKQKGSGNPIEGIKVFGSIPAIAQFKIATTNAKGEFFFELSYRGTQKVIIQTRESNAIIEIHNPISTSPPSPTSGEFIFSDKQLQELQMRSIHMQVQNAFDEQLTIPASNNLRDEPFFGTPDKEYRLDDYTRFPTMEEVLREYVPEVSVRKTRDKYRIFIRNLETNTALEGDPLVLLNGTPIFDHTKLMDVDPLKIEILQIVTQPYYFPNLVFDGIVSYSTYKDKSASSSIDSMAVEYTNYITPREFIRPKYESITLPDVQHLLFWRPEVKIDETGKVNLNFNTSDITGTFLVKVNGITKEGRTGSSSLVFEVKKQ